MPVLESHTIRWKPDGVATIELPADATTREIAVAFSEVSNGVKKATQYLEGPEAALMISEIDGQSTDIHLSKLNLDDSAHFEALVFAIARNLDSR